MAFLQVAKTALLISRKLSKHSASLEAIKESSKESRSGRKPTNSESADSSSDQAKSRDRSQSKLKMEKSKSRNEGPGRFEDERKKVNFKAKRLALLTYNFVMFNASLLTCC